MLLAFIFSGVGAGEWFLLLAVVLVVMGPKNLPSAARKFGQHYAKFRRAAESFKRQLLEMDSEFERAAAEAEREMDSAFEPPPDAVPAVPEGTDGFDGGMEMEAGDAVAEGDAGNAGDGVAAAVEAPTGGVADGSGGDEADKGS